MFQAWQAPAPAGFVSPYPPALAYAPNLGDSPQAMMVWIDNQDSLPCWSFYDPGAGQWLPSQHVTTDTQFQATMQPSLALIGGGDLLLTWVAWMNGQNQIIYSLSARLWPFVKDQ